MEWRIRKSGHGGVVAEYGNSHAGGVEAGNRAGVTMPAFIVYYSGRFDTRKPS